ncbi:MAG: hypothetical protein GWP08_07425 [Nitrospiraceae bacterium]|nr:hypothetical protein [Nitrospiraceae bacterium]
MTVIEECPGEAQWLPFVHDLAAWIDENLHHVDVPVLEEQFVPFAVRHANLFGTWRVARLLKQYHADDPKLVPSVLELLTDADPSAMIIASQLIESAEHPLTKPAVEAAERVLADETGQTKIAVYYARSLVYDYGKKTP